MKKIRCTFGTETVDEAMKEVEMYKKFPHRNIIKVLVRSEFERAYDYEQPLPYKAFLYIYLKDTCTTTEPDQTKAVYIFLPFYRVR
jgi:serine/threonine kinase 16